MGSSRKQLEKSKVAYSYCAARTCGAYPAFRWRRTRRSSDNGPVAFSGVRRALSKRLTFYRAAPATLVGTDISTPDNVSALERRGIRSERGGDAAKIGAVSCLRELPRPMTSSNSRRLPVFFTWLSSPHWPTPGPSASFETATCPRYTQWAPNFHRQSFISSQLTLLRDANKRGRIKLTLITFQRASSLL